MKLEGIKAQVGYRKPRQRGGERHVITPNVLDRQFDPVMPNQAWVTDITYSAPMLGRPLEDAA